MRLSLSSFPWLSRSLDPDVNVTDSLPFVHHRLALRPHPGIPLGVSLEAEYLIPPSGALAHPVQSPDDYVKLYTVPAHVDLAYQLVRMWSADDRRSPLYRTHKPDVVAVSAFNCVIMHETQAHVSSVAEATQLFAHTNIHLSCQLAGFDTFAEQLFARPAPSFAGALVGHYPLFRDWLLLRFGSEASRRACARQCVDALARCVPVLPSLLPHTPSLRLSCSLADDELSLLAATGRRSATPRPPRLEQAASVKSRTCSSGRSTQSTSSCVHLSPLPSFSKYRTDPDASLQAFPQEHFV